MTTTVATQDAYFAGKRPTRAKFRLGQRVRQLIACPSGEQMGARPFIVSGARFCPREGRWHYDAVPERPEPDRFGCVTTSVSGDEGSFAPWPREERP
jgi:hypothetical protein